MTNMEITRHVHPTVLYVEDDPEDFALLTLVMKRCGTPFTLQRAVDGEAALAYLEGVDPYCDRETYPFPDLVLLDLRLPRLNGFEVLQWIRTNPSTRSLPVVVLAGSSFRADIRRALELVCSAAGISPAARYAG